MTVPEKFSCGWLEDYWFPKVDSHLKTVHEHCEGLQPDFCLPCRILAMSFEEHSKACPACAAIPIRPETARALIKKLNDFIEVLRKSGSPEAPKLIAETENLCKKVVSLMETASETTQ